jgi:2-amino-4-hydroxy-6-hydroxymethyldihydropteridine diphosphokinase
MDHRKSISRRTLPWRQAVIGLGGNVGPVPHTFVQALAALQDDHTHIYALSSLYRTVPLVKSHGIKPVPMHNDTPVHPYYYNAACLIMTQLGVHTLLRRLRHTEHLFGRIRSYEWAPRTLDLDLLMYASMHCAHKRLTLPHPGMVHRPFVLYPLRDLQIAQPWAPYSLTVMQALSSCHEAASFIYDRQLSWCVK